MNSRIGQQFGNYRLKRLLGRGGFAEVYLAEHAILETPVAIKLLYGRLTPQDLQDFQQEAKTLAALRHPHILRVLDFGQVDELPFLVMDYAAGGTLRQLYPRGSVVPLPTIVTYVKQIAAALQHTHEAKRIHCDVKPENMLLDERGQILLSDFGIAIIAHSTSSMKTQEQIGTVHYMAPEQIQGKPRRASDQYALAITAYEWLCGERPFQGDSFITIAMQQITTEPPPLRTKSPTIAVDVEQVVMRALTKEPEQRYPSVQEFAIALEQAMSAGSGSIQAGKDAREVSIAPPLTGAKRTVSRTQEPIIPSQGQKEQIKQPMLPASLLAPHPRLLGEKKKARAASSLPNIQSSWSLPDVSLLHSPDNAKLQMYGDDVAELARIIQETLRSFRVDAEVRPDDISIGPTVIRFGIRPTGKPAMMQDEKTGKMVPVRDAAGNIVYDVRTRVSRIMALQNDLALVLEARTIRMEAPVPGRPYVGVEIPNKNSRLVTMREILESKEYQAARTKSRLAVVLGRDVAGQVRVADLARMSHLLIAGTIGTDKSIVINTIIASILMEATPDDVRLLMVDPKMVELNMYNGIPHLLSPVVIKVDRVVSLLKNAINEMERRYRLFSQLGVRNLDGYRKLRLEKISKGDTSLNNLPSIVIIIDELADLMMAAPEEVEGMIVG